MLVDGDVAREKFSIEVERVRRQEKLLRTWGCWVLRSEFPYIDVLFVPSAPLRLTLPLTPGTSLPGIPPGVPQPKFITLGLPSLAGRAFGVRLDLEDYDIVPPSVTFRDPWDWERLLKYDELPRANHTNDSGKSMSILLDEHPIRRRPFLCLRGIREYHEHPQHTGDDWLLYRRDIGVFAILSAVWRTCIQAAHPNLIATPPNMQLRWESIGEAR